MIRVINTYSGILTLVSFIAATIFYFSSVRSDINSLRSGQQVTHHTVAQQMELSRQIREALIQKERDHRSFAKQQDETMLVLREISRALGGIGNVLVKLDLTLDRIDRKMENTK